MKGEVGWFGEGRATEKEREAGYIYNIKCVGKLRQNQASLCLSEVRGVMCVWNFISKQEKKINFQMKKYDAHM